MKAQSELQMLLARASGCTSRNLPSVIRTERALSAVGEGTLCRQHGTDLSLKGAEESGMSVETSVRTEKDKERLRT